MSTEATRTILPFSILSENRDKPFTREMEESSIFCIAELDRQKGGGMILKQPPENVAYIAKTCYPIWFIPWNKTILVFDGLNTTSYNLTYKSIANVKTFIQEMENQSRTLEVYISSLSDNVNRFQTSNKEESLTISGLMTDQQFLGELTSYLNDVNQAAISSSEMAILSPTLDETVISSAKQELDSLRTSFEEDINVLYASMKLLNKTTNSFLKTLRVKMKTIQEEYAKEIKRQETITQPKIDRIRQEHDERVAELSKSFEKQMHPLQKEKIKLEKIRDQRLNRIEHYQVEAKTCTAKKDRVGEQRWKDKINETKKQLSELKEQSKKAEAELKEREERKSHEAFRLKSETEAKVTDAKRDLLELESSRDAKIQVQKQLMEKLNTLTAAIIEQINATAKMRETNVEQLHRLTIRQELQKPGHVYIPFYMTCYHSEKRKRYLVTSPSTVNNVGFSVKLKGALGKAKIKQILTPRFKATASFLNRLPVLIEQNAMLEREIDEAGEANNALKKESALEHLKNGLRLLKEEGWISEKEYDAFGASLI